MIQFFEPRTIENILVAFSDFFNDVYVGVRDNDGNLIEKKKVWFNTFMPSKVFSDRLENYYVDSTGKQSDDPRYYMAVPRMNLNLTGMVPAPEEQTGSNQWRYFYLNKELNDPSLTQVISSYQPTMWVLNFNLTIVTTNAAHLFSIVEGHIAPYCGNTTLVLKVKEIAGLNVSREIQFKIADGVNIDIPDSVTDNERRDCKATINFVCVVPFHRPHVVSQMITKINSRYYDLGTQNTFDTYTTSGYQTSGGYTSAILPIDYTTSGSYRSDVKEYQWFSKHESEK